MRLLQLQHDGDFSLVEHVGNNIPPYAILSHSWGSDNDEVTFRDLVEGTGKGKTGYRKLTFCGKQAAQDGLEFFWVDTCCIDKSSSAELSEAINSMFQWYQNAERCYVYLSDVLCSTANRDDESLRRWKPAFKKSRWFTRGWTLQELIAPASVEFFSTEETYLGNKQSLEQTVHEISGIAVEALRGSPLSQFSVEERLSWAAKRTTKREEDAAYCLLGIFDIQMPLLYGEGPEKALKRLQKEIKESSGDTAAIPPRNTKTNNAARDARLSKILHWLSAPDPSVNYQKALKQRQHDTGLWFLESEQYASWKIDAASCVWLYGIPGCGKTILSSTILQNVLQHCDNNPRQVVAYFYFDFKDVQKQKAEPMLCSLVCQLLQQSIEIPASLDTLCSSYEDGKRQPSLDALLEVTRQIMQKFPQVYIMLDALDECAQRAELMEMLETMAAWQLQNLHLIVTSRRERDIESSLEGLVDSQNSICLQSKVVDKDIQQYVRQRLSDDKGLSKWGKDIALRHEIETALMKGSKGMFRWAVCQLDTLGKCRNRAMLRKSLATLPPTLDKTYDRILCAIAEEDSDYAICVLQWLAFSDRPLSVEEVAEVIAIDVTRDPAFDREEVLEDPLDALDICSSLVTIATDNGDGELELTRQVVVLAHYSVKEYLVSERIQKGQAARYRMQDAACHSIIAQACLGYLSQFQNSEPMADEILKEFKLARYAAELWVSHAQKAEDRIAETNQAAMRLLTTDNAAYLNWIRIHDPEDPWEKPDFRKTLKDIPTPLYYAVLLGLEEVVKLLVDKGADVNAQGGFYGNALQAASEGGHEQVVKLLLDKGADVNTQDGHFGSALQAASYGGHEQVVKLLLDKGAEPDAQGGEFCNALYAASQSGQEQVVKLLLDKGADVNAHSEYLGIILQVASTEGYEQVMKLLLDKGANVNAQGGAYGNALQAASEGGHEQIVKLLLDKGAESDVQGEYFGSALQVASYRGHEKIVRLLLDKGADVNAQGGAYGNALQAASEGGHEQIVKLLLDEGADVNAQGGKYGNALQAASAGVHKQIVRLLLEKGADVNAQGGAYGNALQAASEGGHEQIVKLLLDEGADVNAQGGKYGNALQAASAGVHKQIVRLLLEKGADVNAQGGFFGSALQVASYRGHEKIVRLLLDKGADVNAQGGKYGNALQAASAGVHKQIVKLLLGKGAVNTQGKYYSNTLQAASEGGHLPIVKLPLICYEHN